jgi:type IV pilus assembly protein PilA
MDKRKGFTLIELLIVVVIIGILAAIAIPKFSSAREKAYISAMKSDLRNLSTQQDVYHNGVYSYSTSLSVIGMVPSQGVTITINEASGSGWAATASHLGLGSEHCGLYQGTAAAAGGDPGPAEGIIACTL